jgi:UDP-N-acetylglucosamine--N-acetylmuramyl-(pentapeptide) pyrophosphoryl-undecaprenol N-acetylglucosamine transferase
MKILLSGGGSGGHITPLLAVAHELKKAHPECRIIYIGERGGKFAHLAEENDAIDEVRTILAGKFRRYHGESWAKRLLDVKTNVLNLRDFFLFLCGSLQSLLLVRRLKPNVIFLKGGFVGVPIGLAAAFWHVPFVTHDSDATAGLANRIVGQWAAYHATALPETFYAYPKERTRYVGVLIGDAFQAITPELQAQYKAQLGMSGQNRMLLVTGGSLGAKRLNESFQAVAPKLLEDFSDLVVVHQVGKNGTGVYEEFSHQRLVVLPFLKDMHHYTGAADVVVARAGANTLAELGVQGKAVIVVPNAELAGGHQLKNAEKLAEEGAVVVVHEKNKKKDAVQLDKAIRSLLKDSKQREKLGGRLSEMSPSGAAHRLAMLLLEVESRKT